MLLEKIGAAWKRRMATNVLSIMMGQGASFLLQALYFVVLARVLGATEYGIFAGAFALVNALSPYTTLGGGLLFLRYVSLDPSRARVYWGNAVLTATGLTCLMAAILYFVGPIVTGQKAPILFVVLSVANGLMFQIAAMAGQVFQTYEQLHKMAILSFVTNFSRFVAVIILFFTIRRADAFHWSVAVLAASSASALLALYCVYRKIGPPSFDLALIRKHVTEGFGFSFAGTTQAVYNDIDKTMLSHYGFNTQNGFYTLGYRIVDFASAPMIALDAAMLPGYFQIQGGGMKPVLRRIVRSLRVAILIGIVVAVITLLMSPVVPMVAGSGFADVVEVLRWLCWLPLLRGIHRMSGIALTGSGFQWLRTISQCTVAVANVLMNLAWIPHHGWRGAAWSSVACDGMLGVFNIGLLYYVSRSDLRGDSFFSLHSKEAESEELLEEIVHD